MYPAVDIVSTTPGIAATRGEVAGGNTIVERMYLVYYALCVVYMGDIYVQCRVSGLHRQHD